MYEKLVPVYFKGYYIELHAHSTYIEILAELGIIGLISFLMLFVNFYSYSIKNVKSIVSTGNKFLYIGLLASNFACLVFALLCSIITVGFHDAPMFWLIFGLSFGLSQRVHMKLNEF
jgi:O-antigen ligase